MALDYFTNALRNGYYFDRAIDLVFYDSERKPICALKTPKRGIKPSIVVKGTMIEGSYSINSYISIQNMMYDIDINSVAYIKCRMYYNGITESKAIWETNQELYEQMKNGNVIIFSVLYADQEKEPPNRAVRFQCTVAAQDYTRFSMKANISKDSSISKANGTSKKAAGTGNKGDKGKNIIDLLVEWANAYNDSLPKKDLDSVEFDRITGVNYDEDFGKEKDEKGDYSVSLDESVGEKLGDILRVLNSMGSTKPCPWSIYLSMGVIYVNKIAPPNWKDLAENKGASTVESYMNFYDTNYISGKRKVKMLDGSTNSDERGPVMLNFVKGAYRNDVIIHASTIFDGRIYPGCLCAIKGSAIMGKHGKKNARITAGTDKTILFRATGAIEYEFSTTETSNMSLTGPRIYEDYKVNTKGGK